MPGEKNDEKAGGGRKHGQADFRWLEPEELRWVVTRESSDGGKVSKNEAQLPAGLPIRMGPVGKDEGDRGGKALEELVQKGTAEVDKIVSRKEADILEI